MSKIYYVVIFIVGVASFLIFPNFFIQEGQRESWREYWASSTQPWQSNFTNLEFGDSGLSVVRATTTIKAPRGDITAELSISNAERITGLSGRSGLDPKSGMLFVFEGLGRHGIWMKDMHFPIDIIWLDDEKRVVTVNRDVSPDTFPEVFYPDSEAVYVLELNSGISSVLGIDEGKVLSW